MLTKTCKPAQGEPAGFWVVVVFKKMAVYTLSRTQTLPVTLEHAWEFFSNPGNLREITPDHLGFVVHTDPAFLKNMYAGQVITYTVRPLLGIPMFWMTEITHVEPGRFFVDEQRLGPYALWHHQHHFKAVSEGVEMTDLVHYKLPLGPLGSLAHALFVRRQLQHIFDYRFKKLTSMFGSVHAAESQTD